MQQGLHAPDSSRDTSANGRPRNRAGARSLAERRLAEGAYGPALESMLTALGSRRRSTGCGRSSATSFVSSTFAIPPSRCASRSRARSSTRPSTPATSCGRSPASRFRTLGCAREPLLLRLLEDVVIRDAGLERLLTETRRKLLDAPLPLPVMTAIAHQCFNTEYVFDERPKSARASSVCVLRLRKSSRPTRPIGRSKATRSLRSRGDRSTSQARSGASRRRFLPSVMQEARCPRRSVRSTRRTLIRSWIRLPAPISTEPTA